MFWNVGPSYKLPHHLLGHFFSCCDVLHNGRTNLFRILLSANNYRSFETGLSILGYPTIWAQPCHHHTRTCCPSTTGTGNQRQTLDPKHYIHGSVIQYRHPRFGMGLSPCSICRPSFKRSNIVSGYVYPTGAMLQSEIFDTSHHTPAGSPFSPLLFEQIASVRQVPPGTLLRLPNKSDDTSGTDSKTP